MTAPVSLHETPAPQPSFEPIGVWLVQGEGGSMRWEQLLAAAPGTALCGILSPAPEALAGLRAGPGNVLLVAGAAVLTSGWLDKARVAGMGVVVSAALAWDELFRWGDRAPAVFIPPDASAETLRLAVVSAELSARREALWCGARDELRNRLQDRILLERAKSVLSQRLGVSEEEAYRRIRDAARRQRRPMRGVAQAVLDSRTLFEAERATGSSDWEGVR